MEAIILEDDVDMAEMTAAYLETMNVNCRFAETGAQFRKEMVTKLPDFCIVDWMLPDTDGGECIQWARREFGWDMPILVLTAMDTEEDVVRGLKSGADDYLTKPIRQRELLARVEALTRRVARAEQGLLKAGAFEIDLAGQQMKMDGQLLNMTQKEIDLAYYLFTNPGKLFSRMHLLDKVWGISADVDTRTVDTHVSRLRKKLDLSGDKGFKLVPVYGQGYRMEKA